MCVCVCACLFACLFSFETVQLSKSSICFDFALPFVSHKSFWLSATKLFSHSKWFAYYNTLIFFFILSLSTSVNRFLYLFLLLHIAFLSLSPTLRYNVRINMLSLLMVNKAKYPRSMRTTKIYWNKTHHTNIHRITCNFYRI